MGADSARARALSSPAYAFAASFSPFVVAVFMKATMTTSMGTQLMMTSVSFHDV